MRRCELISNSSMGNKLTYIWPIHYFSNLNSQELIIWKSPVFEHCLHHHSWLLRAATGRGQSYFSLYLKLVSGNSYEVKANLKLSVLNPVSEKCIMTMEKEVFFTQGKLCGFVRFADILSLRKQVYEDTLTVVCKLTISPDTKPFQVAEGKMIEDIGNLFDSKAFSDVTLAAGGHEIKAHKAMLSARSVVFAAMFKHEMKENKLNLVDITDVDHEVLKEMLRFIYTGKSPNLDKLAGQLLAAADKYALERLKLMCEKQLCENLSVETAAESLTFAERHTANQLKVQTIDFIIRHAANVMETQGWKNIITTNSNLVSEVFQKLVTQQTSDIEPPAKRQKRVILDL